MTADTHSSPAATDSNLVARSLQGDREAFAAIVRRYQAIVCALTYAACGDRHRSEDLAQETFLAAWKSLRELKDPNRLRAWLRGIARNVVFNAQRKVSRSPNMLAPPEGDALPSDAPSPSDDAITREEHALLWENLAKLPEDYREPLVLYYRQGESAAAVAEALEISEDAARQRLSRGRAMLARRIEGLIDRGLRQTAPGHGFALGVIAALPGMTATKATATIGASAKALGTMGTLTTAILGPVIGFASGYLGYRIGLQQTIAAEERHLMRRFFRGVIFFALGFALAIFAVVFGSYWLHLRHGVTEGLIFAVSGLYAAGLLGAVICYSRRLPKLRAQLLAENPSLLQHAQDTSRAWAIQYRSRWSLFGWPLIHVNMGQTPDGRPAYARGWIAIGANAHGLIFALGAVAIAPISWGGCSIGILTWGGFAVGIWTVGVIAVGWKAVGVIVAAWHGASGIVAVAMGYAIGITVFARHANDARANATLNGEAFFRSWDWIANHGNWIWPIAILGMLPMYLRARKLQRAASGDPQRGHV